MAIKPPTHFVIIELPDPNYVISTKNGNPLEAGVDYLLSEQNELSFQRVAGLENIYTKVFFRYKIIDNLNSNQSNEAYGTLEWKNTIPGIPSSADHLETIANSSVHNFLEKLPINNNVETIKIVSIEGLNVAKFNDQKLFSGQVLKAQELLYTELVAKSEGGGEPYFKMTYNVGKNNVYEKTNYILQFNIDSLANIGQNGDTELLEYSEEYDVPPPTEYNVKQETFKIDISLGQIKGIAEIEVIINSPFLALNEWNNVYVYSGENEYEKFANETFNIFVPLDENGKGSFTVQNFIIENTGDDKDGEITLNLLNINGNAALVDPANNQLVLTSNY